MSKTIEQKVADILQEIEKNIEGFKIISKDDPKWYRCHWTATLAWAFFNIVGIFSKKAKENFLNNFVTVFDGRIVAFPKGKKFKNLNQPIVHEILRHEYIHMRDHKKHPVWFPLSYVLVLPAVFTMRAHWEFRGYAASMLAHYERYGDIPDRVIDNITKHFVYNSYFWMCPFPKYVRKRLNKIRQDIHDGKISGYYW